MEEELSAKCLDVRVTHRRFVWSSSWTWGLDSVAGLILEKDCVLMTQCKTVRGADDGRIA